MGVCISSLEEGCCDYLNNLGCIDGDALSDTHPTVDNILECNDKYILIEEKSFLLDFFRKACIGKTKFSHFISNGELEDSFFEFLSTLDKKEKGSLFKQCSLELLEEIPRKVSTTLGYLENTVKIENSKNVILYCSNSGTEIDKIASIIFARYNNEEENTVIECKQLEKFLKSKGCA